MLSRDISDFINYACLCALCLRGDKLFYSQCVVYDVSAMDEMMHLFLRVQFALARS